METLEKGVSLDALLWISLGGVAKLSTKWRCSLPKFERVAIKNGALFSGKAGKYSPLRGVGIPSTLPYKEGLIMRPSSLQRGSHDETPLKTQSIM
jgi:hypothetical protein